MNITPKTQLTRYQPRFITIHQQMHHLVFTQLHYMGKLKTPTRYHVRVHTP
jgi:hypothetical protein